MVLACIIVAYVVSVVFCVLGSRYSNKYYDYEAMAVEVMISLIPVINLIWGIVCYLDVCFHEHPLKLRWLLNLYDGKK